MKIKHTSQLLYDLLECKDEDTVYIIDQENDYNLLWTKGEKK